MRYMDKRIKIAFLTSLDARDKKSWSCTYYSMAEALQKYCGEIYYIGPIKSRMESILSFFEKLLRFLFKKNFKYLHSIMLSKSYAKLFTRKLSNQHYDIIFAPSVSTEIAFLDTKIPIIYFSDTTFKLMINFYKSYSNLFKRSIRNGNLIEFSAINKASLIIYPTKWPVQSAVNDYNGDINKIHTIQLGTNVKKIPSIDIILKRNLNDPCILFFLGVNWDRKGGTIAFNTLLKLEELGIHSKLIVCGCVPPSNLKHKWMTVIPYLDRNHEIQNNKLYNLYLTSHFIFLPTRAETMGMVFCEALAFGLPSITTDVGGVKEVVIEKKTGFTLPHSADSVDYAEIITKTWQDKTLYIEMVKNCYKYYNTNFSWELWANKLNTLIKSILVSS